MKIAVCFLALILVFSGCSAPTFETIGDVQHVGNMDVAQGQVALDIPADATVLTAAGTDILYTCTGYSMSLQTLPAGNISATVRTISGYEVSELTLIQSRCGNHNRYDWVWVAAGEDGDMLCRAAVLDDGVFHYSLCVFADEDQASDLTATWNLLFQSFCLDTQEKV